MQIDIMSKKAAHSNDYSGSGQSVRCRLHGPVTGYRLWRRAIKTVKLIRLFQLF
ncbi:MAG: hypothetical protein WBO34_03780 [Gammaproteobacteria bacterium]